MYGIDTHLPLGRKGLSNVDHIYLKHPRDKISTACVACRNLSLLVNGLVWQNALVYCRDEDGFENVVKDNARGSEHGVKICKFL
jgi:hypothetical protein